MADAPHSPSQTEDRKLEAFFKEYLEGLFIRQPVTATGLGDHRYDAMLDDVSPEVRAGWAEADRHTLDALPREIAYARLSRDGQVDFEILKNSLETGIWSHDQERHFERDPRAYGHYLSDSVYQLVAKSTLPRETNVSNAIARIAAIPRIIASAKQGLTDPVAPALETAIRQNAGAIRFYEKDLFDFAGETAQRRELEAAAAEAVTHLRGYQQFLEGLRERATPHWRLGREKFERKFALHTGIGITAAENLASAEAEFARVHQALYAIARELWPQCCAGQPLPAADEAGRRETVTGVIGILNQEHGEPDEVLGRVRGAIDGIKDFIREHDYLRLPEPDNCAIVEMPEFHRGNSLAYLDSAPPLDPEAASFYAVSPPPADWSAGQKRSFLEEYNDYMLRILTIHEAYPGHYVQLAWANRDASLIRRVLGSGTYIEGWAVFGEETMLDEGYGGGDLRLRLMQLKFYLRAITNSILDYKMHCAEMTDGDAMQFLTRDAFQTQGEAALKIIRAKQSSVQLSTYFAGRMALHHLRETFQQELGAQFHLGRYHEAVLHIGAVPPKYMPELVRARLAHPR